MNYQKIYNQIIERSKTRILEGYKEHHHIIPKCMGGSDDKFNIVELTAKEHFLCHQLLCEIYPNIHKLKQAVWLMIIGKRNKHKRNNYKISSRLYERLKIEISKGMRGVERSNKTKLKIGRSRRGYKFSDDSKRKMSLSKIGKKQFNPHKGRKT